MTTEKTLFSALILILLCTFPLASQDGQDFKVGDSVYISAPSGLNMRDEPSLSGNKVTALSYNSKILVLDVSENIQQIQGKSSRWIFTRYNGRTGWIFGGYVSSRLSGNISNDFRYYLSRGRTDSYSIHIGMNLSTAYEILGTPGRTVGFMGQQVSIFENPFLNVFGEKEITQITWGDESCGTVYGLLPEVTTEEGIIAIIGKPDEISIIEPDMDGEAINVGRNFIYRESGFTLLININNKEEFIDYITLKGN